MNRWLVLLLQIAWFTSLLGEAPSAGFMPPPTSHTNHISGEISEPIHDEFSPAQEQAMWADIQRNLALLRTANAPYQTQTVTYNFPLRVAPGLPDYAGFRVSAFVDHDSSAGVLDYNGGTRTYDTHRGTDYALYPYGWNKLDAGEVQVIAAAAGTIVAKSNGDATDHNCNVPSGDNWNYVALTHADGRMTIYGHMRYNSLTSKGVGQTVTQGEYLGTAASSGNSSGPHLHFEVRYGSYSNNEYIDPYAGPNSQAESLWTSQRPYFDSGINRLSTHAGQAFDTTCAPSTIYLQDSFTTPTRIRFYAYYRDYHGPLTTQFKIYRPDNSVYQTWQDVPSDNTFYSGAFRDKFFDFTNSDPAGTWRFEAVYNGQTYTTFFNVNAPTSIAVSSPNGGEQWNRQLAHSLTWADNLGGDVNIALYRNGIYSATIASNTPSDGVYIWTPDPTFALGAGYTVRVTSVTSPTLFDVSNAVFTLTALSASDDFGLTLLNTPITINVLTNDTFPNGTPITITAVGSPLSGTVSVINAQLLYTPTLAFLGPDTFTYTVSINTEQANASVTVRVVTEIFHVFLPLIRR